MKEKIYTIPINDAFDKKCACPICEIENKLNEEAVDSTLGASMMEPDFRIITNEKGFCKQHYTELLSKSKALPLALIMQSQIEIQNKSIMTAAPSDAKKLFKKVSSKKSAAKSCADIVNKLISSCAICDKIEHTMDKFLENTVYLWKTQPDFKQKFSGKSFCLPHFAKLLQFGIDGLSDNDFEIFYNEVLSTQTNALCRLYDDVSEFTKLFDHRSSGNPSDEVKTALKRSVHIYSGLMQND